MTGDPTPMDGKPARRAVGGYPADTRMEALVRLLDRTLRRVEQLDGRMTALTETVADLAHTTPTSPECVSDHLAVATPAGGETKTGGGKGLRGPGVRSWLLADDPVQADADLDDLIGWLWRVYLWFPDTTLSSCWLWHPEVIEELWWLRVAHADAYDHRTGTSLRVADWHDPPPPGRRAACAWSTGQVPAHPPHPVQQPPRGGVPARSARARPPRSRRRRGVGGRIWSGRGPRARPGAQSRADR